MLRRLLALSLVTAVAVGVASSAQAVPPTITLSSPSGQTDNPVTITGKAGSNIGDAYQVTVEVFRGDKAEGDAIFTQFVFVNESTREFSALVDRELEDGVYSARATQMNGEQESGTSNLLVFRIGPPPAETATPTPTPEPTPVVQESTAPDAVFANEYQPPYVCKSRRDFVKHVPRPRKGKRLRVTATLNGERWEHTVGKDFVLVRLDLRGMPKATYTLKVTLKFTRPDGKRVTKRSVEQIDYHTCVPKGSV
jgi:hypothetical protein